MDDTNNIAKSLGQVSEMIASNKALIACAEKWFEIVGEALQQRPQAVIPADELKKVYSAAAHGVSDTRCATPDVNAVNKLVAGKIIDDLAGSVKETTQEAVMEVVDQHPVKVEHTHVHTTAFDLVKYADSKLQRWIYILVGTFVILVSAIGINAFQYYNSREYWGERYYDVLASKYTTDAERKVMKENLSYVLAVPQEFRSSSGLVKEKIRRNETILKKRAAEARANKGMWSTKDPLER